MFVAVDITKSFGDLTVGTHLGQSVVIDIRNYIYKHKHIIVMM